jgi:inhibitor of KinA sporulation pathway (predicted exonuclease)
MILFSLDFEATGLDLEKDRIIEVGFALYSTGRERVIEQTSFLVNSDGVPVTEEATSVTRITQDMVNIFGHPQGDVIGAYNDYWAASEAIIGHNITWFDMPMLRNAGQRTGYGLPEDRLLIDTMTDIPGVKGQKLITMCADARDPKTGRDVGFTYTKHSALDDAKAVLRLISWHDIDAIAVRAHTPTYIALSHQDRGDANNQSARAAGFRWNGKYKVWWQPVKECDWDDLVAAAANAAIPFKIGITKDFTWEQLRNRD